jgi:hypothetical protein
MLEQKEMPILGKQEESAEKIRTVFDDELKQESKKQYTEEEKKGFFKELMTAWYTPGVHNSLFERVPETLHPDIVNRFLERGMYRLVTRNLANIKGINFENLFSLFLKRGAYIVSLESIIELGRFLNFTDQDIFKNIISKNIGIDAHLAVGNMINNISLFSGLNQEAAILLIKAGEGDGVVSNLEVFSGIDHADITNCLIVSGKKELVFDNLDKFTGLTVAGFRRIPEIDSFLTQFESIIPGIINKFTVEQVLEIASEPTKKQKEVSLILKTAPFLAEAFFANRYGIKLVFKYPELDALSKENISLLYGTKENRGNTEQDTLEFRALVQERLGMYKNNGKIVGSLQRKGVDTEKWLKFQELSIFDLGEEEDTSFAERIHLPITRLNESKEKYIKSFRETLKPYFAELSRLSITEDTHALKENLEKMKEAREKAKTNGNDKKADGIQKGIDSLQAKIDNPKQAPVWDRIMGEVASIERVMSGVIVSADAITEHEKVVAELAETQSHENRKKLIEAKTQNLVLEKKFRENLSLLDTRIADFEKNIGELLARFIGEEEKEKIFTVFHKVALEDRDHINTDISTLQKLLEDEEDEGKGTTPFKGTPMSIGVWNRNPDEDLYLGNYTDCCIRIDSDHMGEESTIADYLTDLGMQVVMARDEKKNIPVVAAWSFIGKNTKTGEAALVIDNIEANTDYSIPFQSQLSEKLKAYFEKYAQSIGVSKIVQGTANNDLKIFKMDGDYVKLGGYNRKDGYFLEGERDSEDDDDDENNEEEWEDDNDTKEDYQEDPDPMNENPKEEQDDYFDIEERLNGRR